MEEPQPDPVLNFTTFPAAAKTPELKTFTPSIASLPLTCAASNFVDPVSLLYPP